MSTRVCVTYSVEHTGPSAACQIKQMTDGFISLNDNGEFKSANRVVERKRSKVHYAQHKREQKARRGLYMTIM